MGGSLRRHKRRKPVVLKAKKSSKKRAASSKAIKSRVPDEVSAERPDLKKKLGLDAEWDPHSHTAANMERLGLVVDANAGWGRNKKADAVTAAAEADPDLLEREPDDELKAACGQMRKSGAAPPKRLTPHQRQVIERLIQRHGSDLRAMSLDRELNKMQHSEGVLKKMIESFQCWKNGSGVDFRVPNKRLW